uniref:putative F-box/LRR-repeat protein 23 n=1 Tax=Erigeron canadensis TaxID=72917 RepID=UPI001CB9575D|nr:putative F-box/LRR-repeat protein 23 [Erigeron canadensis]
MSISSSSANLNLKNQKRDWLDLPSDVTANILQRVGVSDILEDAQKVCTAWRKICKDPCMWKVIKIVSFDDKMMGKKAVDRSQGQLVDISICSCNDQLLSYVANRSRQLRRLEVVLHFDDELRRISEHLMKFSLLEEFNLYSAGKSWKKSFIETAGRYCPMLKTLKLNQTPCNRLIGDNANEVAIAIGENLHGLRHLELNGNNMSNIGLQAILDGCVCLETLDLRKCMRIDLNGDTGTRCFEQIRCVKLPSDSLEGSPHEDIYEENIVPDYNLFYYYAPELFDGYISQ